MSGKTKSNATLNHLDALAKLMDSQFRIPGTSIRFGIDSIMGLIPGAGDIGGLVVSGYMIVVLVANGASGFVLARISLNVLIDTLVGSIPLFGDIFDVAFKSNQRNMKLVHQHYTEGRHQGGAWKVIVPVLLVLILLCIGIVWCVYSVLAWLFDYFS